MSHQESDNFIEDARLLLPWYLTNTLSDKEQSLVNRALEASGELRKEFVREEQMMRLVKENTSLLELSALDTTEQRLENTLARIEREEQQVVQKQQRAEQVASPGAEDKAGLGGWLQQLFGRGLFDREWLTPANAVFASLLAAHVGVLGYAQLSAPGADYEAASVAKPAVVLEANSVKALFLMEFQDDARFNDVYSFLSKRDAQIVAGPEGSNGMFTVAINTNSHTNSAKFAELLMAEAKKTKAPVTFIGSKFAD